jgi:peptidoglycan hydrolase CwlO-like protein
VVTSAVLNGSLGLFLLSISECQFFTFFHILLKIIQVNDFKKKLEDQSSVIEGFEEAKKKATHDIDTLQQRIESLTDENDKLSKSKKKLQAEVSIQVIIDYEVYNFMFYCYFVR